MYSNQNLLHNQSARSRYSKLSDDIKKMEFSLQEHQTAQDPTLELLGPALTSVLKSRKRIMMTLIGINASR